MRLVYLIVLGILLAACSTAPSSTAEPLQPGDAARGEALFSQTINEAPPCSSCHRLDGTPLVGPSLQGFGDVAAARIEGMAAEDYARASILQPASHLASGYRNLMYSQYEQRLTPQQTSDLIAYILTL